MRHDRRDTDRTAVHFDADHLAHGVPGGRVRLPRLRGRVDEDHVVLDGDTLSPPVEVIGGGFVKDEVDPDRGSRGERDHRTGIPDAEPVHMSFSDYSPNESLFAHFRSGPAAEPGPDSGNVSTITDGDDDLTRVLGLDPDADWSTIRSAHRRLLTQLHPDRYVTADERTRSEAAERLAAINVAYHELEKARRAV